MLDNKISKSLALSTHKDTNGNTNKHMHPLYCVNLLANKISATKDFPPDVDAQYTIFCPRVNTPGEFSTSDCQSYNFLIPFLCKYFTNDSGKCNECNGIVSAVVVSASCFFFCSFLSSVGESIGGSEAKKLLECCCIGRRATAFCCCCSFSPNAAAVKSKDLRLRFEVFNESLLVPTGPTFSIKNCASSFSFSSSSSEKNRGEDNITSSSCIVVIS